jgi:hypothetical protein
MTTTRQILIGLAAMWMLLGSAIAQDVEPDDVTFTVEKIEMDLLKYQDTYPNAKGFGSGGKDEWLRILVEYTVTVDNKRNRNKMQNGTYWIDQAQFDWRMVIMGSADKSDPTERWSFKGKQSVTYANIKADGQKHRAEIYVHPRLIQRFAPAMKKGQILFELKMRVGGKTRGEALGQGDKIMSAKEMPRTRSGLSMLDSEDIRLIDYALLNRRETPWQWSSEESFEMIIPSP